MMNSLDNSNMTGDLTPKVDQVNREDREKEEEIQVEQESLSQEEFDSMVEPTLDSNQQEEWNEMLKLWNARFEMNEKEEEEFAEKLREWKDLLISKRIFSPDGSMSVSSVGSEQENAWDEQMEVWKTRLSRQVGLEGDNEWQTPDQVVEK
jgi:hypothetical protein